jgi:hypothetical protein
MADPTHDVSVAWAEVSVPTDDIDLTEWRGSEDGEIREVTGWCPACRARAGRIVEPPAEPEGVAPERDRVGAPRRARPRPNLIFVSCECGSSHSHDGADSCGRTWQVPWDRLQREDG